MGKHNQPLGTGMCPCTTELGQFIRDRRLALGLRQVQLADLVGVQFSVISGLEIGTRRFLNEAQVLRFASALQCDPEEIRKRMPEKGKQPTTELGKLVQARRIELGLTRAQLARKMKRHHTTIYELELGDGVPPYKLLPSLATALQLPHATFAKFLMKPSDGSMLKLGELIRTRRKELGLSQGDLARELGVSLQAVHAIEKGVVGLGKSPQTIAKLEQILKLEEGTLAALVEKRTRTVKRKKDTLGAFITEHRKTLGLSQRQLAKRANIAQSTLCYYERGDSEKKPRRRLILKLEKALGCEIPQELISAIKKA